MKTINFINVSIREGIYDVLNRYSLDVRDLSEEIKYRVLYLLPTYVIIENIRTSKEYNKKNKKIDIKWLKEERMFDIIELLK